MNLRTLLSLGVLVSSIALPGIASAHDMGRGAMHRGFDRVERVGRFERGREVFRGPAIFRGREIPRGHGFSNWRR